MAFQSGEEAIGSGVTTVNVTYPVAFGAAPDFVIAVVQNLTDDPQLSLKAQVTSSSSTDFEVELSATTDSANYELAWIAGDTALVFSAITKLGTRITDLPAPSRELKPQDRIAVVQNGATNSVPFRDFESAFALKQESPPSASTDAGRISSVAYDADNAYLHVGDRWLRIARTGHPTDWNIPGVNSTKPAQGGTVALADTDTDVSVVYPVAFPSDGAAPVITFTLSNTVDVSPTAIYGFVTASSLSGFTVKFSTAIDADNWKLNWHAVQY